MDLSTDLVTVALYTEPTYIVQGQEPYWIGDKLDVCIERKLQRDNIQAFNHI